MNVYNPQNWGTHGPAAGTHVRHSRVSILGGSRAMADITGMEASLPSPPPPYFATPAAPLPPPPMNASNFHISPLGTSFAQPQDPSPTSVRSAYSPTGIYGTSQGMSYPRSVAPSVNNTPQLPQQPSPTLFPPPPSNPRDRSSSRARGVLNNFSAWANRHKGPDPVARSFSSGDSVPQEWREESNAQPALQPSGHINTPADVPTSAPAARRAISVGYAGPPVLHSRDFSRTRDAATDQAPWAPGMPLPPPPPGPPPTTRSQSLGPTLPTSSLAQPPAGPFTTPPRQPHRGTVLGSVPPTPADWVDEDERQSQARPEDGVAGRLPPLGMLRFETRREGSTKGIRERRSESRARSRDAHVESVHIPQTLPSGFEDAAPVDLVISTNSNLISRRRHASKPSPTTGTLQSQVASEVSGYHGLQMANVLEDSNNDSALTWLPNQNGSAPARFMPTPPFSPESPNDVVGLHGTKEPLARFLRLSLDRYRALIEKERKAATDADRLKLFADFMIKESRLQRERFSDAFEGIANELMGTTSDMWLPEEPSPLTAASSPDGAIYTEAQQDKPSPLSTRNLAEICKYEPVLSPVLSTSASNFADEADARGRPSSRWWEASTASGSATGSINRKAEQTVRDLNHMSISYDEQILPANLAARALEVDPALAPVEQASITKSKLEYHDHVDNNKTPTWRPSTADLTSILTPRPCRIDVSHLITLPPPYPRRYPALNKSHPRLTGERAALRRISDPDVLNTIRAQRKSIATTFDHSEVSRWIAQLRTMISEASGCLETLEREVRDAQSHGRSVARQGDAEPGLVERITLMKWLFEAREHLLWEQYALDHATHHNITQPIANPLFPNSTTEAQKSLSRHEHFYSTIRTLTTNGIQSLAAAFWDIGPKLSSLVFTLLSYSLPALSTALDIPPRERAANPSYADQPLKYLHAVLSHAEASMRQFVDGQIDLLCVGHEVACSVARARRKAERARFRAGNGSDDLPESLAAVVETEGDEGELTRQLQARVKDVENQWSSALGDDMERCRSAVERYLLEGEETGTGGFEERDAWVRGVETEYPRR